MKKVLNTGLSGIAAGMILYIAAFIYYKILGDGAASPITALAAPAMLAAGLLAANLGKLKMFAGAAGYFLYEKPLLKSTGNLFLIYAANFAGCFFMHNLLRFSFLLPGLISGTETTLNELFSGACPSAVSAAYNSVSNSFGTDAGVLIGFAPWFIVRSMICGILTFIGIEYYKRAGKFYMLILAVFGYTIGGFSNCMTTLTGVLLATAVYSFSFAAQFIIISTTALGNLLGGILASAVLRAVGNKAEPAGADG